MKKRFFEHLKNKENTEIKLEEVKKKPKKKFHKDYEAKHIDKSENNEDELFDDVQNLFD